MVDLNATIFPILGPVGEFVTTIKVFVGGVFGIYLLLLYFRWREYIFTRGILTSIRKDIHMLAERQGIALDPIKESHIIRFTKHLTRKFKNAPAGEKSRARPKRKRRAVRKR